MRTHLFLIFLALSVCGTKSEYDIGTEMYEKGEYPTALYHLNKSIEKEPDPAWAYNNRAIVKLELFDTLGALSDYSEAIRLDPKFSIAYANRSDLFYFLYRPEEALDDINMSISIDSTESVSFNDRGYVFIDLRDTVSACNDFLRASKLGNEKAKVALVRFCNK